MEDDRGVLGVSRSPLEDFTYRFDARAPLCGRRRSDRLSPSARIDFPGKHGSQLALRFVNK